MNEEIHLIHKVLSSAENDLTTGEIAKRIFKISGLKVSAKIIQNYLWSYFRHDILYNKEKYTYKYKTSKNYEWEEIVIEKKLNGNRPISVTVIGKKLEITYDEKVSLIEFIRAFTILSLTKGGKNEIDLIKRLNRLIECER